MDLSTKRQSLSFTVICVIVWGISFVGGQFIACPEDWVTNDLKCYRFVFYPELNHDQARAHCGQNGASLLGVNSRAEHEFVSDWLFDNDLSRREFYTSGLVRNLKTGDLIWQSDGSVVSPNLQFWLNDEERAKAGQFITYKYGVVTYGWSRTQGQSNLPFICEISRQEAYRITEVRRGFDYGLNVFDPNEIPRGPKFFEEPTDLLMITNLEDIVVECAAFSNPPPSYRMYRTLLSTGETTLITPWMDKRYAVTNGRLTISHPREGEDAGFYHCEAENPYGVVRSHSGMLSFGMLGEFSNVPRDKVRVHEHRYGIIDCVPPSFKPAVAYGWMKFTPGNFLRTDLMTHLFVSYNGKLYFSEVSISDAAVYYCMIKLMPQTGAAIGTDQPPARISLPVELQITDSLPVDWGPQISNDFIAVFPSQPLRGHTVRLECLAFGTMPIYYEWRRQGWPLPLNTTLSEANRVLEISWAQLEDSGEYICRAFRDTTSTGSAFQERSFHLIMQAVPYFIHGLGDQHVDEGRQLTWRCEARGVPAPTYSWLKNGVVLTSSEGDVEIFGNVLTVMSPDAARHDGMYQCRASNHHGETYSSGQLRVLGFEPMFTKKPVHSKTMGAQGGTVTIMCSPEAAPQPEITWLKDGSPVGSPDEEARVRVLGNGNLVLHELVSSDEGNYECRAENSYGVASSTGFLQVLDGTTITSKPVDTSVLMNSSAFLACQPSYDTALDVEVSWLFQGTPLNWKDTHYRKGEAGGVSGLYIQGTEKKHSGIYTCQAETSFDTVSASAVLNVQGPPGEPAGVIVMMKEGMPMDSVYLQWTPGQLWGAPISYYTVQAAAASSSSSQKGDVWVVWGDDIIESSTANHEGGERRETFVEKLKPWNSYRFRIRARNVYGNGPYSLPTSFYQTPSAPPFRAPTNITAGVGKVGDLSIIWVPLPVEDQGGPGIGYIVYYRLHSRPDDRWIKADVGNVDSFVVLVGPDLFYTLYDVKVQAFNDEGSGPNSTMETIYSAEGMPVGVPTNVLIDLYNATALLITWIRVDDTREAAGGKIQGYGINYWERDQKNPIVNSHYTGENSDSALVIGLLALTWYTMNVQVYNAAGSGPASEEYSQHTWKNDIKTQPTEITVMSHSMDSVYVTFRGVTVKPNEENLLGYYLQYWPATDNIRTAKTVFTKKNPYGVISGLHMDVVYKLRVYPYSRGGDGASSPDRLFTLGGLINYDPVTTEILAGSDRLLQNVALLVICLGLSLLFTRL